MTVKRLVSPLRQWIVLSVLWYVTAIPTQISDSYERGVPISLRNILLTVLMPFAGFAIAVLIGTAFRWIRDGFRRNEQ